ncbi:trace amine-associated receptor 13c-like [Salarias fasciatus]|uniref:trace amine-associated receptor 13c-like n=1 Tax=Salarias fasciatus TaxID=181472 RepID=UPI001176C225|nr:trace amine-associated receptor 13c-like [Salarias fasciatus]
MEILEEAELCFPQLANASCKKLKRPHFQLVLSYIVLSSIALLTTTLNLLLIVSIAHFRRLHTPTNFLLLSLAVSDFLVGVIVCVPILLVDGCWYLGDHTCVFFQYLGYVVTGASIGTMVIISVDRYVAVCDPLRYASRMTQQRVQVSVCVCWTGSLLFQSLNLKENLSEPGRYHSCSGECVVVTDYVLGLLDLLLSFVGPVLVIVLLYLRVFAVAVSQARAARSRLAAVGGRGSLTVSVKKSELKAARTLGVVVLVFLVCVCPYFCVLLTGQNQLLNASSAVFVICLFYLNSCLNPLIYAFCYPWFKKSVQLIITLKILQPGSANANIL